jgi:hypothetical protein
MKPVLILAKNGYRFIFFVIPTVERGPIPLGKHFGDFQPSPQI